MLQESDLNEIEVKEGEESVRINRKGDVEIPQQIVARRCKVRCENVDEPEENLSFIQSPMVVLYRSPAPGKPPFIEIGQRVKRTII